MPVKISYNSYMNTVKIADLKNNLSRHLWHVREGGEVVVLDRDTPVARIVPFGPPGTRTAAARDAFAAGHLTDLERQGLVVRGNPRAVADWLRARTPAARPAGAPSAVDLLIGARRESLR